MRCLLFVLTIFLSIANGYAQPGRWQLKDFAIDLNQLVTPPGQLWVGSGYTTVMPIPGSVFGTADVLAPPISGGHLSLQVLFVANGDTIQDRFVWGSKPNNLLYTGGTWQPDRIIRRGIYHRNHADGVISFELLSQLIPLADRPGFLVRYEVKNLGTSNLKFTLVPLFDPGKPSVIPLEKWGFMPPAIEQVAVTKTGNDQWNTDKLWIQLFSEGGEMLLAAGESKIGRLGVLLSVKEAAGPDSGAVSGPDPGKDLSASGSSGLGNWEKKTNAIWEERLRWALGNVPTLHSTDKALENYYKRSIVSGLVCIWEKPDFALNPTLVTSGLDGGSMTSYLWDIGGYAPQLITLMLGDKILPIVRKMAAIDLERYNAYTPDGVGSGVRYAYSTVSFTSLVYAIACQKKAYPDLFDQVKRLVLKDEERPMVNGVVDYGEQKNLLEMRGMGWEHRVPSPNSERVWCFRRLAEMGTDLGYDGPTIATWKKNADTIASAIRKELWDEKAGWFFCKYPNGHRELVYSIQVFDMLRSGVCTPVMKKRILAQLVDHKFLFRYGVSSISKADSLHYEETDTDWGGGGAYAGDIPQLALDLYHEGLPGKAWDVLKRQFWLGELWPYFPQEHFCDRPASPLFKRANIIAGLTGAEAILYGLMGLDPRLDGSLWINPQLDQGMALKPQLDQDMALNPRATAPNEVAINGYGFRGHFIDISVSSSFCRIDVDGKSVYRGKPKRFRIL